MARILKDALVLLLFFFFIGCNKDTVFCCKKGVYTASLKDVSFSVSAEKAGRLISFRYGKEEMLLQSDVEPTYYGATFWLSPQEWHWPPYPVLDEWAYDAVQKDGKLELFSPPDQTAGIEVKKEFSFSKDGAVFITYCLKNISEEVKYLAPWDVTRVLGGITFFPVGEADIINRSSISDAYEQDGIIWYEMGKKPITDAQKLFSTAKEGWIAHYRNGVLWVKCFPDISLSQLPPGHGEVEIYVAPNGKYVELENHGEYVSLLPGALLVYKQKWFLVKAPLGANADHKALLDIVRQLNKSISE